MEAKRRYAKVKPEDILAPVLCHVEVIVGDKIHDGEGGRYPVGTVLSVPPHTAESLRRQGFAK